MEKTNESCETCKFWRRPYDSSVGDGGDCRWRPKVVLKQSCEWCGQYESIATKEPADATKQLTLKVTAEDGRTFEIIPTLGLDAIEIDTGTHIEFKPIGNPTSRTTTGERVEVCDGKVVVYDMVTLEPIEVTLEDPCVTVVDQVEP